MRAQGVSRALAVALLAGAAACSGENNTGPGSQTFVATMTSAQETSLKVPSQATGTATFTVTGNQIMLASLTVQNIDSVTASHIHLAPAGVAGGIIVPLLALAPPSGPITASQALVTNLRITQASIIGIGSAPAISVDSLLALFRSGGAYVNVHTRFNPAGEIRGQIMAR